MCRRQIGCAILVAAAFVAIDIHVSAQAQVSDEELLAFAKDRHNQPRITSAPFWMDYAALVALRRSN